MWREFLIGMSTIAKQNNDEILTAGRKNYEKGVMKYFHV